MYAFHINICVDVWNETSSVGNVVTVNQTIFVMRGSRQLCQRGSSYRYDNFFVVVFVFCSWWEKRRKNPKPLMRTSETPLKAFLWRADDGPTLNAGFAAL